MSHTLFPTHQFLGDYFLIENCDKLFVDVFRLFPSMVSVVVDSGGGSFIEGGGHWKKYVGAFDCILVELGMLHHPQTAYNQLFTQTKKTKKRIFEKC